MTIPRHIPFGSTVKVKPGDQVAVDTIIAESFSSLGYRNIKVAQVIGVNPSSLEKYITRKIGDRIYKGEILAEKKGSLGIGKKIMTAPLDGIIKDIHKNDGVVTIEYLPTQEKTASFIKGEVIKSDNPETMLIKSNVTQINGILGTGKERTGFIKVLVKPDDFLLPHNLDISCHKAIIVGGAMISRATLEKALAIGVSAIITGGIHLKDLESLGAKKKIQEDGKSSDVGITVIVTEGYGRIPMGEDIWITLFTLNGKLALVSGDEHKVIIPVENGKETQVMEIKERELKTGDTVRILTEPAFGAVGKVANIKKEEETLPSGIKTRLVTIKIGKEDKQIPFQNIEILI